ncbi:signal peptidase II [Candidatus Uhrbacteria bacterium]|nr:signal peptidase II [Candidatus Uhrbacteria bacterium]
MLVSKKTLPVIALFTSSAILFADLLSKDLFFNRSAEPPTFSFFHGAIQNTYHKNFGMIGDFPVASFVIIPLSLIILALILLALRRTIRQNHLYQTIALALIIGGALGNLFDRIAFGYVRDWILLGSRSAMNLADLIILIGMALLIVFWKTPDVTMKK